jgi:hypothetical protein
VTGGWPEAEPAAGTPEALALTRVKVCALRSRNTICVPDVAMPTSRLSASVANATRVPSCDTAGLKLVPLSAAPSPLSESCSTVSSTRS